MIPALLLQAATVAAPAPAPWAVVQRGDGATTSSAWSSDGKARLVVRCDVKGEKIVSIQFIPRTPFAAATPRPVSIMADEASWLGANWQFPGSGAFISDDRIVSNLAVVIAQGKTIHIRAMSPENEAVDATFTGPGDAPVRKVLTACGYGFGVAPSRSAVPFPRVTRDPGVAHAADPPDDQ